MGARVSDLEVLQHRVAQWFEIPLARVLVLREGDFVHLVNEMEQAVLEDEQRRKLHRATRDRYIA